MILKRNVYVRKVISFFYKPKRRFNSDIWSIFIDIFRFWPMFYTVS